MILKNTKLDKKTPALRSYCTVVLNDKVICLLFHSHPHSSLLFSASPPPSLSSPPLRCESGGQVHSLQLWKAMAGSGQR